MAVKLTSTTIAHKNQLESEYPFVWLYEIQTADATPVRYRFTNWTERLSYRGNTYYPFQVVHGGIAYRTGAAPKMDVAVGAQSLELAPIIDGEAGMVGNPAKVLIVSILDIDDSSAALEWIGEVEGVVMEEEQATFAISGHNAFGSRFPGNVFSRRKCRYTFGDQRCGYDIALGLFDRCGTKKDDTVVAAPYTLAACRAIGADEVASGLTSQHPRRFGGFPAIKPARGT